MTLEARSERSTFGREALLWYGVLGGPLAWLLAFGLGYLLEEAICPRDAQSPDVWGASLQGVAAGVAIVGALLALGAVLAALAAWRGLARDERDADPRGRALFMAVTGTLGSALFLLTIVLNGVAVAALEPCTTG